MSVAIVAGFSTGEGALHSPGPEEHFLDRGMDADEVHELREKARSGCPLCVTSQPWLPCDHRLRRHEDERIGEGLVAAEQPDHRYFDDPPFDHLVSVHRDERAGEIRISGCSWESVYKLQEQFRIYAQGIWEFGMEVYELLFPAHMEAELRKVGFIQ